MIIQLNHPGSQKQFKLGKGYRNNGSGIIREWNNDTNHYRKYIKHNGYYVNGVQELNPTQADLYFWGEWEGNSLFTPFPKADYRILPNGIHNPLHSNLIRGLQNTDPYIYGEEFKYCVCKQKGQLTTLVLDDLILFGTVFPSLNKFYIDTVFIIKSHNLSSSVQASNGACYTKIYKEETLEQLSEYLKTPMNINNNRIYHSKTWWNDKEYFSFVPCKLSFENVGFERLYIDLNNGIFQLSRNPTGISFLKKCTLSSQDLWKEIVNECIIQGFKLGVKFDEPSHSNLYNEEKMVIKC